MARKIRSDIKIGNLEKKLGLQEGAIRNPDGSNARSDKKLGTLQAEYERMFAGPPVRKNNAPTPQSSNKPPKSSSKKPTSSSTAPKTRKK